MWLGLPKQLEDKIIPEPNSGCWLWTASLDSKGYGAVRVNGVLHRAHRLVYALLRQPTDMTIDHLCRVRCCVNPDHLEPVTSLENFLRGNRNGNTLKTHCLRGHAFTVENTYQFYEGERLCRECQRERVRRYRVARSRT